MRHLILDIETVGHPDAGNWLEPCKAPANYKDPAKIAAAVAEATAERNDKLALDPDCCRVVAFGWVLVGSNNPTVHLAKDEFEEREGLKLLWDAYAAVPGQQETRFVTFYGRSFDLPVLLRRSMYLGVKAPKLNLDRYRSPHIDVWDELTFKGALRTAHSLKFYAKRLGIGTLDKVDGADIGKLVAAGDWDAVHAHCLSDIGLTHALANKLGLLDMVAA